MTRSNLPRWNMLETSLLRDHDDIDFFSRNELLNPQFQLDILYRKGTAFNNSLRSGCYLRCLINFGIRMNAKRPSHPCAGGGASPGVRPRGERNAFPCIQMQRFCADTCPPSLPIRFAFSTIFFSRYINCRFRREKKALRQQSGHQKTAKGAVFHRTLRRASTQKPPLNRPVSSHHVSFSLGSIRFS